MKSLKYIPFFLLILMVGAGYASTKVSDQQEYTGGKVPRPDHILIYDFVATPKDIPTDSALAGQHSEHNTPQTAEQVETGKKLGAEIAAHMVEEIRAMGLPAERASDNSEAQINDLIIRGYLLSIQEGDVKKRVAIGFGSGASELKAAVEGFRMTETGLVKLGSGKLDSGSSKTPGSAMGAVALIATHNPLGLIVGTGIKAYGEKSGKSTVEGRAEQIAKEITDQLKKKFEEQGWL